MTFDGKATLDSTLPDPLGDLKRMGRCKSMSAQQRPHGAGCRVEHVLLCRERHLMGFQHEDHRRCGTDMLVAAAKAKLKAICRCVAVLSQGLPSHGMR
jgi:hypothetical protein